jgi:hypothetical protein
MALAESALLTSWLHPHRLAFRAKGTSLATATNVSTAPVLLPLASQLTPGTCSGPSTVIVAAWRGAAVDSLSDSLLPAQTSWAKALRCCKTSSNVRSSPALRPASKHQMLTLLLLKGRLYPLHGTFCLGSFVLVYYCYPETMVRRSSRCADLGFADAELQNRACH